MSFQNTAPDRELFNGVMQAISRRTSPRLSLVKIKEAYYERECRSYREVSRGRCPAGSAIKEAVVADSVARESPRVRTTRVRRMRDTANTASTGPATLQQQRYQKSGLHDDGRPYIKTAAHLQEPWLDVRNGERILGKRREKHRAEREVESA